MLGFFTNYYSVGYNSILCKTRYYLLTACQLISRGCIVMACLDRFLLCSQNVQRRAFCQRKVALKMIFLIISTCLCLSIYVLIVYEPNSAIGRIIDTTVSFVFNFGIPAVSMSSLSGLIIWKLKQNSQRFAPQRIHVRKRDVQLSAMLIGQVILYIVTALPFVSNFVYLSIIQYDRPSMRTPYRNAAENLATVATGAFVTYVFNAMNFYIYTLTVSSFRRELFAMIIPSQPSNYRT
ncbi:unnamed protein product [Adineta ricciae]|uniref:G-protein coupled receptors family 1 profile domain-containing protein n=1 Tax=Adineta ricciae TaxID=249248 RepID=A0A816EW51_ADIRI|nr:unnamed protein product [Adineta ricciae]